MKDAKRGKKSMKHFQILPVSNEFHNSSYVRTTQAISVYDYGSIFVSLFNGWFISSDFSTLVGWTILAPFTWLR